MIRVPDFTLACANKDSAEAPHRFQVTARFDHKDPAARRYPKMTVIFRPPIELENLLPFDINYRVYNKKTNQTWASYLRRGGVIPVHYAQLDHLVMLSIDALETGKDISLVLIVFVSLINF